MLHIMNNLPSAYDGLIENLEDKLDATLDPLTLSVNNDDEEEAEEEEVNENDVEADQVNPKARNVWARDNNPDHQARRQAWQRFSRRNLREKEKLPGKMLKEKTEGEPAST